MFWKGVLFGANVPANYLLVCFGVSIYDGAREHWVVAPTQCLCNRLGE